MPTTKIQSINLNDILLDTSNYRTGEKLTQEKSIEALIQDQGDKIINLAIDISKNDLSPLDNIAVYVDSDNGGEKFTVVEGNRRILALKILNNPSLLDKTALEIKKKNILALDKKSFEKILCVVFSNREDATRWMSLKHTGENEGKGVVQWSARAKSRFEQSGGNKKNKNATEILDFLGKNGVKIDNDYPITNLQRLLGTPEVRETLGITGTNPIRTKVPPDQFKPLMEKVVADLSQIGALNRIKQREDRLAYVEGLGIKPSIEGEEWSLETNSEGKTEPNKSKHSQDNSSTTPENSESTTKTKKRTKPSASNRKKFIPSSFQLSIDQHRTNDIFRELKKLNSGEHPNACAVLIRVFLELSLEGFMQKSGLHFNDNTPLHAKINTCMKYMEENNMMTENQIHPIKVMTSNPASFFSTKTLNAYVHNSKMIVDPTTLNNTWDTLSDFIEKLWDQK
ncbi:hypothetical protein [Dethiosulfovibrio salsuginis]|uniref:ParB/Sulfiredoxin domain-containing protein n=1 Tax=Dethiosulfovibrio salsuginis TaxID=561720 RepID=A0A1X7KH58_9BACT|nr:hypothetical protein [Dethiosulfovibrio salsuginis]SMG40629.1 hypothetical protein SAMN06275492_12815 [Dethiosulfovibrio salsuginis]